MPTRVRGFRIGGAYWEATSFSIAARRDDDGVRVQEERQGYTYAALGMFLIEPNAWSLTHLASGLRVCRIEATPIEAFRKATVIADVGNWAFRAEAIRDAMARKVYNIIKADPAMTRGDE